MEKCFTTIELVNISAYITNLNRNSDKINCLPLKFKWYLQKNMNKILPVVQEFETFKNDELKKIQSKWFDETHSEEFMQPRRDAEGNPVLDADNNEICDPMRRIKEEYQDDYRKVIEELNTKLGEISHEKNIIDINTVDFDNFVDNLPDDTQLEIHDLTMLSFMDTVSNVYKEAE